jgi:hypothetical protein
MQKISGKKLGDIKQAALRQAAAFVAARETGIGFYLPYINLYHDGEQWVIDGNTMAQFQDRFEPLVIDWAMACTESLSIIKDEDYDPNLGEDIEEARAAKEIVESNKNEIIAIAKQLVDALFSKHDLVAHCKW